MHLSHYLGLLHAAQTELGRCLRTVADAHADEADVAHLCRRLAEQCDGHAHLLRPFEARYAALAPQAPDQLHPDRFAGPRSGPLGLLRDLQDLYVMAAECDICWTLIGQAAQGARDTDLLDVVGRCEGETATQLAWLRSRMKQAAPQALLVAT
jgi:hypothetical protein